MKTMKIPRRVIEGPHQKQDGNAVFNSSLNNRRIAGLAMVAIVLMLSLTVTYSRPVAGDGTDRYEELWITQQAAGRISILHPYSVLAGSPVETISLPAGAHPHITTFSPDSRFAYVSDMGNGTLYVIRADDRQIVGALHLAPTLVHQAKPSPDGTIVLVSQIANQTLFRIAANEASQTWTASGSLKLTSTGKAPICTVFRNDGLRAYVSLLPSGIAVVDVPTMTLLGTIPTDGFIACGMIKSHDGNTVFIASSGSGGHLYLLDTTSDTLIDTGHTLGAGSWHSFNISPNERVGYGTSPGVDQLQIIDLQQGTATPFFLDPTPGTGNDQPDAIAVQGNNVYVTLRMSGKLAVIDAQQLTVSYIDLAPPSTSVNPANCMGCALHGVTVRPEPDLTGTNIGLSSPSPASLAFALAAKRNSHIHIIGISKATQGTAEPIDFLLHCGL